MKKIFIAGPYTKGDVAVNVNNHMRAHSLLMDAGFAPFNPLLFHFQHMAHPRPYEDWTKLDNEYLLVCDAVLRLSGESKGADAEVKLARKNGIPIYYNINKLIHELH